MALAVYQGTATDENGRALDWPFTVRVMSDDAGSPRMVRLYQDRDGVTPESNAMTVTSSKGWEPGFFRFYANGGPHRILITKGSWEAEELRHVAIGTYGEADQGQLNDPGYLIEFESETTAPPTSGYFRANNADLSLATIIWVSDTSRGGFDITSRLTELDPGTKAIKNTAIFAGANGGGASWLVDDATDSGAYITLTVSGHAGDTAFETDLYSLQREISGADGEDSAESVNGQTDAAANKSTLGDTDRLPLVNKVDNSLAYQTWAQRKTQIISDIGPIQNSLLTTRGDMIRRGASAPERFAKGSEGLILRAGADDPAWSNLVTLATPQATTSGTSVDLTGIPSWARLVVVTLKGISTSGSSVPIFQLGDAGGFETSGYLGTGGYIGASGNSGAAAQTTGFGINSTNASGNTYSGRAVFELHEESTNTWIYAFTGTYTSGAFGLWGSGDKSLTQALTSIRLTTVGGSDTFDLGSIALRYF